MQLLLVIFQEILIVAAYFISLGISLIELYLFSDCLERVIFKKLTLTDTPQAIITWMVIILIPITFIPAIQVWEWPNIETWLYLWGIAIVGTLAHFSWTKSYTMAEITSLESIEFIKLPIMALFGWMIFSEIPATGVGIGGLMIFISTIYISHREIKVSSSVRPNQDTQESKL